jgi:hypothetical protein
MSTPFMMWFVAISMAVLGYIVGTVSHHICVMGQLL